jgi:hypothetical protein
MGLNQNVGYARWNALKISKKVSLLLAVLGFELKPLCLLGPQPDKSSVLTGVLVFCNSLCILFPAPSLATHTHTHTHTHTTILIYYYNGHADPFRKGSSLD